MDSNLLAQVEQFMRHQDQARERQIRELKKEPDSRAAIGCVMYEALASDTMQRFFADGYAPAHRLVLAYLNATEYLSTGYMRDQPTRFSMLYTPTDAEALSFTLETLTAPRLTFKKSGLQEIFAKPEAFEGDSQLTWLTSLPILGTPWFGYPADYIFRLEFNPNIYARDTLNAPVLEHMLQEAVCDVLTSKGQMAYRGNFPGIFRDRSEDSDILGFAPDFRPKPMPDPNRPDMV